MADTNLSPETTGNYRCTSCGNTSKFVGYDDRGFPGDACECEAQEDEDLDCTCEVTLTQPFTVVDGEVVYQSFTGGGCDAEIGSYTRIECAECGEEIWAEAAAPAASSL